MAIAKVRDLVTANNLTVQATTAMALSGIGASTTVGNTLIARIGSDNSATGGAAPGLTISDTAGGNTWVVNAIVALQDPGNVNLGAVCYIARCHVSVAQTTAHTINLAWTGTAPAAKSVVIEEWSGINTGDAQPVGAANNFGAGTTCTNPHFPSAAGMLIYDAIAIEGPTGDTWTPDTDTFNGSWVNLTSVSTASGTAAANITIRGQYKIVTGTGQNDWNVSFTSRDWASMASEYSASGGAVDVRPRRLLSKSVAIKRASVR